MRVLMLNYEFPPVGGGGGIANWNLLRCYSGRSDLHVDLVTSGPGVGLQVERFAQNITIHRLGIRKHSIHFWTRGEVIRWLRLAGRLYGRMLGQGRYDLAHAFFGFPTGYVCWRNWRVLPYVISLRGSDVPGGHARLKVDYVLLGPVIRAIWRRAGRLVACSRGLRARALAFLPSVQIEVIPNGVDLQRFCPADRPLPSRPFMLITVGRLSVTKRVDVLIATAERLRQAGLDLRLTIVGGGPLERRIRHMVQRMRLADVVQMTGPVGPDQMPDLYRRHHVFVSASQQEGMSNAMLEAISSGLPIVTSYCEGVDELIGDNGVVLEQGGPDRYASVLLDLARDPARLAWMSAAARQRAEGLAWSDIAQQYLDLYGRLIYPGSGPSVGAEG